jgi:hypothetical protein
MKQGNPQGKGLVPVLDAWQGAQPRAVTAKNTETILRDYFTTLLVLSAEFAFKPVPGMPYYLYLGGGRWRLSLISPDEWGPGAPGSCLGCCFLMPDMAWRIELLTDPTSEPALRDALRAFHAGFIELLADSDTLEAGLPHYVKSLPYYRRLLAAGLANSLSHSLRLSGLDGTGTSHWLEAAGATALLPARA